MRKPVHRNAATWVALAVITAAGLTLTGGRSVLASGSNRSGLEILSDSASVSSAVIPGAGRLGTDRNATVNAELLETIIRLDRVNRGIISSVAYKAPEEEGIILPENSER